MRISAKVLFFIGCFITLLAAFLSSIIPSFSPLPFIIVGVALSIWQWYRSEREQRQQVEQERKVTNNSIVGSTYMGQNQLLFNQFNKLKDSLERKKLGDLFKQNDPS